MPSVSGTRFVDGGLERPRFTKASVELLLAKFEGESFKQLVSLLNEVNSKHIWSDRFPNWDRAPGAHFNHARPRSSISSVSSLLNALA